MARYTYGDSQLAAERLALIAATFEPATRAFLEAAGPTRSSLAVDLGCGPGFTTRLLHEALGAKRTVGVDASAAYIARAAAGAPDGVSFVEHDVTRVPLPAGPADAIYARLLLAHLEDPSAVVARWTTQLEHGGVLLLDDLEAIDTDATAFRAYLEDVAVPVVRSQGGVLLVGPTLHEMSDPPGTERDHEEVASFTPPAATSARIFAMNLAVLTERGEIEPRPELAAGLEAIAAGRALAEPVTWRMRQLALRRLG
ncbi:MAG: class I SAM-dependent methyltransferase [Actinomycetota bacterium]